MKISFDLDDTIIPGIKSFHTEPQSFLHRLVGIERIRIGTILLFRELKRRNHSVGIYTTSYRSVFKIRLTFLLNGFVPDFVINQPMHLKALENLSFKPSKYPNAFNIDIHIDDSKGVEMEGKLYNFKTIILQEQELQWTRFILSKIESTL